MTTYAAPVIVAAALAASAVALVAQSTPRQLPTPTRPARAVVAIRTVATVKQLMHAIVIPSSDELFKAAGEPPSSDAGWTAVQHHALAVAEAGNLLMMGNRPVDRTSWMTMSRAMVDAAADAAAAAEKKSGDALSAAGDKVYETCETCHAKYMKK
jgi:hypothetical protein